MLSFLGQHPFCHLPSPALLSLFGRFLVNLACWRTPIMGIMPCLVAYTPSSTTRRMGCVRQSSITSMCLGPSRTMTLIRWLILFVLINAQLFSYLCKLAPVVVCSIIIIIAWPSKLIVKENNFACLLPSSGSSKRQQLRNGSKKVHSQV